MRFLQTYIHQQELRDLLTGRAMVQQPTVLLNVECPGCGLAYFRSGGTTDNVRERQRLERSARQFLHLECADHGHHFIVR